jgi:hypothetical protein
MTYAGHLRELRTPVNSMIGFSRVILKGIDGAVPATHQAAIEQVYHDTCAILRVINSVWERGTRYRD